MPATLLGIPAHAPKSLSFADFCEYFQPVMAEPPSLPELQLNATDALPAVADGVPGLCGAVGAAFVVKVTSSMIPPVH